MAETPITADEFAARLPKLCLKGAGAGLPRRERDRAILFKSVTLTLAPGHRYSETELDASLVSWLERCAPGLGADHVSLRRELVDAAVLERSPDGAWYRLPKPSVLDPRFDPPVDVLDPPSLIEIARERMAAAREAQVAPIAPDAD